jgi:DNA-binding NtrC family response regulator
MAGEKHRRRKVLIVEDDQSLANVYRTAFRFEGFDVESAGDGMSALSRIEQERPDLVVLDLQLPRLRGEAVLDEIASSRGTRATPVIVVTGADPATRIVPAAAFLQKPCASDRLISVIERHLAAD